MKKTLSMKLFVDDKRGLCLTVVHTTVTDDDGITETHRTESTEAWLPSSLPSAINEIVTEYIGVMHALVPETPIEKAARG